MTEQTRHEEYMNEVLALCEAAKEIGDVRSRPSSSETTR